MLATTKFWWYTTRSSGIISWALLALSVLWGLALSTKVFGKRPRPNWLLDLHRFLGGLSVVFAVIHVAAIVLDSFVQFGAIDILVPFATDYHPVAVAWGIIAMYGLLAVEVTSLLRKKLSKQTWQAVHYLSFPLFALATIHLLAVGTDRKTFLLRTTVIAGSVAVIVLTAIRAARADRHDLMASPKV
jgi:DMSO/TMAO reductase YedYZ heme-binding membrane subunit